MKTVFFESLRYKLITKNDFYYGSCPDIHFTTSIRKRKISCCYYETFCHISSRVDSKLLSQDPDGYVMRRWPSQPTNVGVVSMGFMLPFLPKEGWWTVRAVVKGQVQDKKFRVTKWYTPRFEVRE